MLGRLPIQQWWRTSQGPDWTTRPSVLWWLVPAKAWWCCHLYDTRWPRSSRLKLIYVYKAVLWTCWSCSVCVCVCVCVCLCLCYDIKLVMFCLDTTFVRLDLSNPIKGGSASLYSHLCTKELVSMLNAVFVCWRWLCLTMTWYFYQQNHIVVNIHGHTHDCPGRVTIGKTVVINPGPLLWENWSQCTMPKLRCLFTIMQRGTLWSVHTSSQNELKSILETHVIILFWPPLTLCINDIIFGRLMGSWYYIVYIYHNYTRIIVCVHTTTQHVDLLVYCNCHIYYY